MSIRHQRGGYAITGETASYSSGESDVYLIKTDPAGVEQFSRNLGGDLSDLGRSVQQTNDGGYIITGYSQTSPGWTGWDVYLIKTDFFGWEQWSQTYGGNLSDGGSSVLKTDDGGYIISGHFGPWGNQKDLYVIRTDALGNEVWSLIIDSGFDEAGLCIRQTNDGGYIIAGMRSWGGYDCSDVYLVRLASETGVIELNLPQPVAYFLLPAYPNPFNPSTLIRFEIPTAGDVQIQIYDIQGNIVATLTDGWQTPGSYQLTFDGSNLVSGIYIARLTTGDFSASGKMVLMK